MGSSRRGLCAQTDTTTLNELEGITRVRSHPSLEAEVPLAGGKQNDPGAQRLGQLPVAAVTT